MKSNANDAELIAEAYSKRDYDHSPSAQVKLADDYKARQGKKAKPDFLDVDKDGNKEEAMKTALKDKGGNNPSEDQEHSCGYEQVLEPVVAQVSTVDESEMHVALADLHKASKYAAALTDLLGNVGSLEGWTAVKIAKAADYLGAVFDKLDYDLNGHSVHNTGYEDAPTEDNQY